jgi:sigma-B regulation protein RsbU (phosphoserine phosphatase)
LAAKGIILGVIEEIRLQEREVTIEPEDILILYTDGVTEAINAQEEEFGEQRLIETIANNHGNSCAQLVHAIYAAVSDFGRAQFDDYTLVALKRNR